MVQRKFAIGLCVLVTLAIVTSLAISKVQQPSWLRELKTGLTANEVQKLMRGDRPANASECWFTHELQSWNKDGWLIRVHYRNELVSKVEILTAPNRSFISWIRAWIFG